MSKRFPMPIPFGWFAVAYADELQPGESKPIHYFGEELVLYRGETGTPHVLDAYCPHLGAHLGHGIRGQSGHGGAIVGDTIVCPFHAWRFDDKGFCVEVPYATNMPPKVQGKQCLKSWPTVERNQMIWVWYHPEGAAPLWEVEVFPEANDPDWGEFQRFEWILNTHTQEMAENGADPAHFRYVHGTATFPEYDIHYEDYRVRGLQKAKMTTPRGDVDGEIRNGSFGPGQGFTRFSGICETFLMGLVSPIDADTTHVRFLFNQPKKDGKTQTGGVAAAIIRDICKQLEEDKPIWENKVYRPLPILCDGDGPIAKFRKWYSQFYVGYTQERG